ncbi:MAG: bifunctional metallophosphatase/5'-nucleotidase [Erysipelotrichaceae bacterium]|nr:bifunctional metallophosphatase/5'-nucleotidase [Erysipelotrichaceae bacterium]
MTKKNLKPLTILHSNDIHGDFMAEVIEEKTLGGVSMLSGYLQKVRKEEKNVIYTISGDMIRGSLIDSEYQGLSTIDIMNALAPDVVTLGNHEVDYGVAHLLFLERCARFPIINANLYLTNSGVRLFRSHLIKEIDGMKILFIGVMTEEVLASARQEKLIGSFVDVREAAGEIGKICNNYQSEDIDFTVILTHIGFEEDKKLAALLDERWGVDLIIGGHSHTLLEEPAVVNGIPIVQAAMGTDQLGRFDIMVNTDTNTIDSYKWQLVEISEKNCPRDKELEALVEQYQSQTDAKYGRYLTRFKEVYTHPRRDRETQLGSLFADIFCDALDLDVFFLGSGSIRQESMGTIVQYKHLSETFPYADEIYRITVTGKQLKKMIETIYRPESFSGEHTEFYQYSHGMMIEVSWGEKKVKSITFNGEDIPDDATFNVGLQSFHFKNMQAFLGLSEEEVGEIRKPRVVTTSSTDILDEWLSTHELVVAPTTPRLIITD